jgi:hypothetical protein
MVCMSNCHSVCWPVYELDVWSTVVRFSAEARHFSKDRSHQTRSGAYIASCQLCASRPFSRAEWPLRKPDHSPPYSVEVMNEWSYSSTVVYVLMSWCLIKHTYRFTFPLPDVSAIVGRKMWLTGYATPVRVVWNVYNIVIGKPNHKSLRRKPLCEDNIKMKCQYAKCKTVDKTQLSQHRAQWRAPVIDFRFT